MPGEQTLWHELIAAAERAIDEDFRSPLSTGTASLAEVSVTAFLVVLDRIAVPMWNTSRMTNEWAQCERNEAEAFFVDVAALRKPNRGGPMTTPEQPVTVGDLRVPCEHRVFGGRHHVNLPHDETNPDGPDIAWCDGGRPAQVADLVSALRAEGAAIRIWWCHVHEEAGPWTEPPYQMLQCSIGARLWSSSPNAEKTCYVAAAVIVFDALAESQPFPPAGG